MKQGFKAKRNVTPKQVIEMLQKNGIVIDEEKAREVLNTLYFLSELIVKQKLNK